MKKQQIDIKDSVCIVGGGAAGLVAACIAARNGAKVVLFEKNASEKKLASEQFFDNAYLGKKLLSLGTGFYVLRVCSGSIGAGISGEAVSERRHESRGYSFRYSCLCQYGMLLRGQ